MITVIDVIRALTEKLESAFPGIQVTNKDVTAGFPRPCFYISQEKSSIAKGCGLIDRDISLTFFYIGKLTEKYLELLQVQIKLEEILAAGIEVAPGFLIHPENIESIASNPDKAVQIDCTLLLRQEIEDNDTSGYMEDLEVELN